MTREELVEEMVDAYAQKQGCLSRDFGQVTHEGMAAALNVAVGELLGDATAGEVNQHLYSSCGPDGFFNTVTCFRRSRYLKPKSAEERVTIEHRNVLHSVYKDGKEIACFSDGSVADALRIGLIQQLKELEAHARL